MFRTIYLLILLAAVACALTAGSVMANSWSLSADFSTNSNPSGQWTYGRSDGITVNEAGLGQWSNWMGNSQDGQTFDNAFLAWTNWGSIPADAIAKSLVASTSSRGGSVAAGTVIIQTSNDRDDWARWTAPTTGSGLYNVNVTFGGVGSNSNNYTAAVVKVYKVSNGSFSQLWTSYLDGTNITRSYSYNGLMLASGDSLEFLVSRFDNTGHDWYWDFQRNISTTVDATVSETTTGPVTGTVKGTVSASGGGPLSGATVRDIGDDNTTTTGTDGTYTLYGVPSASSRTLEASLKGYSTEQRTGVTVSAGGTTSGQDINTLVPSYIRGSVTESGTGNPVVGATIATPGYPSVTTDGSGNYTLQVSPGTYEVDATDPNHSPASLTGITVARAENKTGQNILMDPVTATVKGTITAAGGALAGATVRDTLGSASTSSGSDGTYTLIGVVPGASRVIEASKPGYSTGSLTFDAVAGTTYTGKNFNLTASYIRGTVTELGTGTPIVGAKVAASSVSGAYSTVTTGGGAYVLQVSPGTYSVTASGAGHLPATISVIVAAGDDLSGKNIHVTLGSDLAGDFTTSQGNPNQNWSYMFDCGTITSGLMTRTPAYAYPGNTAADQSWGPDWLDPIWIGTDAPVFVMNLAGFTTTTMNATLVSRESQKVVAGLATRSENKAIVRWTAPNSGVYAVTARWAGANAGAQASVGIRKNGAYIWGAGGTQVVDGFQGTSINSFTDSSGSSPVVTFSNNVALTVGDTLDTVAGYLASRSWVQLDMTVAKATSGVGTISGVVTSDLSTHNPIPNAQVQVIGGMQPFIAYTAADGSYSLTVPVGVYDISVSASGYSDDNSVSGISVADGQMITHNYMMHFLGMWDFVQDYTVIANPNGQWSLYSNGISPASLCTWGKFLDYLYSGVHTWGSTGTDGLNIWSGWFFKNTTGQPFGWTASVPPNYAQSPTGYIENNQICVGGANYCEPTIRWTSPDQRVIKVNLTFTCQEPWAQDTLTMQLRKNGSPIVTKSVKGFVGRASSLFSDSVGPSPRSSCVLNLVVNSGDAIDFVAGLTAQRPAIGIQNLQISQGSGTACSSLTTLKSQAVGTTVFLTVPTALVCESNRFNDYSFYLESDDRSQGVKCVGNADLPVIDFGATHDQGKKITLTGVMAADPYDATKKVVQVQSINSIDSAAIPKPVGLGSKALAAGPTARNMAVKVWGKLLEQVANTDPSTSTNWPWLYWTISDGGVNVKIPMIGQSGYMTSASLLAISMNDYISVVGVETVDSSGAIVVSPWAEGNITDNTGQ